jgi:hypothetical protein
MTPFHVLESRLLRTPLAVRFLDPITGDGVSDDLFVIAWPLGNPQSVWPARQSPASATFGFADLPGLLDYELCIDTSLPSPLHFVLRVADRRARFLPVIKELALPLAEPAVQEVTLFSASTRPSPSGCATIRGQVTLGDSTPAAWAAVDIRYAGDTRYTALADQRGQFVLYLPYPDALPALAGSPPHGGLVHQLAWPITVAVRFWPACTRRLSALVEDPPELESLGAQVLTMIEDGVYAFESVAFTLRFGEPLVVASTGQRTLKLLAA